MTVTVRHYHHQVVVTDAPYNARGDGVTDDTVAIQSAITDCSTAGGGSVYLPKGEYRLTTWIKMQSNVRLFGDGPSSILSNDKTNATIDKDACLLPGLHHPSLMSTQTGYALNAITANDFSVTTTTAADAGNLTTGQLVIVGSDTDISGVSRHAQLNKVVSAVAGTGVVTLADAIEEGISDGKIWTISGTDASTETDIYAVENVIVEKIGFKGRSAFASKGAVYNGIFRDLHMHDTHMFFGTNMLTHVLIENLSGQYSGRYLEFAMNSYDVTARNWKGQFRALSALQAGESQVFPINVGEQAYRITLDDIFCHIDSRYTQNTEFAQIKGSKIAINRPDWRHAGTSGSFLLNIPDCAFTGFRHDDIVFTDAKLAAPGKARIGTIGGSAVAAENPRDVHFFGGYCNESVTAESMWFQGGQKFSFYMQDNTGKTFKVSLAAQYPMLPGSKRITRLANGAIVKHTIVKYGGTGDVDPATAVSDRIAGVYIGPSNAADNEQVQIQVLGECHLSCAGAIGSGMTLTTNGSGQGVNAAPAAGTNNKTVGQAMIAGTDTTIPVNVVPGWFQG